MENGCELRVRRFGALRFMRTMMSTRPAVGLTEKAHPHNGAFFMLRLLKITWLLTVRIHTKTGGKRALCVSVASKKSFMPDKQQRDFMGKPRGQFELEKPLWERLSLFCGEGGIRTLDTLTSILPFQGSQINHSCTSPDVG